MTTSTCVHHWIIEAPNGPTSSGRCKNCGALRDDFRNSVVETNYRTENLTRKRASPNPRYPINPATGLSFRLTREQRNEMVEAYLRGERPVDLVRQYGITKGSLFKAVRAARAKGLT